MKSARRAVLILAWAFAPYGGASAIAGSHLTTLSLAPTGQGLQLSSFYIGDIGVENDVFAMPYRGGRSGLLARNRQSGAINLYRSDGATMNWLGPNGQTDPSFQFLFGDLDGDGLPDLVAQNPADGALYYYRNDGAALQYQGSLGAVGYTTEEWLVDFDGDGKADFIRRAPENQMIYVYRSDGSTLTPPLSFGPIGTNVQLVVGDVNGDGKADLLGRDVNTGAITVYLSNGTNVDAVAAGAIGVENDLYLADLDGDGKADLVSRNRATGEVYYYRSNGSYFDFVGDVGWLALDPADGALRFADFNGDGKAEIVARAVPGVAVISPATGPSAGVLGVLGRATIATAVHVSFNGGATSVSTPVVNGRWLVFSPDAVHDVIPNGPATVIVSAQHADGDNAPPVSIPLSVSGKNPAYAIDPATVFPSPASIVPTGKAYSDIVPATLDLAEQARQYLRAAVASHVGEIYPRWANVVPPGRAAPGSPAVLSAYALATASGGGNAADLCFGNPPCLTELNATPNWGKVAREMFHARRISGDADAATLSGQYASVSTMLDYNTTLWLSIRQMPYLALNGGPGPTTTVLEALTALYEQNPANQAVKAAGNEYVRMHKEDLHTCDGQYQCVFSVLVPPDQRENNGGYVAPQSWNMFINGKVATALFRWYEVTGSSDALALAATLNLYLREDAKLWANPDTSRFPQDGPGQSFGILRSGLAPALSFIAEARLLLAKSRNDPTGLDDARRARDLLEFLKRRTLGGPLGTFGEIGTVGDAIRVALELSELNDLYFHDPSFNYYDQAESWLRNQLAESQIDKYDAPFISDGQSGDSRFDRIRDRSVGMFFSGATFSWALPLNVFVYNDDGPANAMWGLYTAWDHALREQGATARVNLLLNRAGTYLDVKSDVPYRGRVAIQTKADLGPVRDLTVRKPGWADASQVAVSRIDASGATTTLVPGSGWTWNADRSFLTVAGVIPATTYVISFPMVARELPFYERRNPEDWWFEQMYDSPLGGSHEVTNAYVGRFLGDTLVDVTSKPAWVDACLARGNAPGGCVRRYNRDDLKSLIRQAGGSLSVAETAPPQVTVSRFAPQAPGGPSAVDSGLRAYDGASVVKLAAQPAGTLTSPLRLRGKDNAVHGVLLVDPADPAASKLKISTPQGVKALRKF